MVVAYRQRKAAVQAINQPTYISKYSCLLFSQHEMNIDVK